MIQILAGTKEISENFALYVFRAIFATLDRFIYKFISVLYDILMNLVSTPIFSEASINQFANRIYVLVGMIMLFRVTISLINYLINPDAIKDKTEGAGNVAKNVIITLVLIIIVPYAFNFAYNLQYAIIDDNIIPNIILGRNNDKIEEMKISISDQKWKTGNNKGKEICKDIDKVEIDSNGDYMALMTFLPFFQVNDGFLRISSIDSEDQNILSNYCAGNSVGSLLAGGDIPFYSWTYKSFSTNQEVYVIDYSILFSTIAGVIVALLLLSFCFDIAVRSIKLGFLEIFAPIPIISYIDPKSGKSGLFKKWLTEVGKTWVSLFIRLATLYFAIYIIKLVNDSEIDYADEKTKIWAMLFLIIGALMFAKQAPKLIEDLLGIKSGLQLNPFKKISDEALGGKAVLGLGAAGAAIGLGAATNFGTRAIQTAGNVIKAEGAGNKFKALGAGLLKTAGSTVAGGVSSGYNAFQRTRKDGNVINGAWHGYQESNYSRFMRDENLRKAGVNGLADGFIYGVESIEADAARLTGNMSRGQRNQIKVQEDKKKAETMKSNLEKYKNVTTKPLNNLKSYYDQIDKGLEKTDRVKDAQRRLDVARSKGESVSRIQYLESQVKQAKIDEYNNFMQTEQGKAIQNGINSITYQNSSGEQITATTPNSYADLKQASRDNDIEIIRNNSTVSNEETRIAEYEDKIKQFETSHEYQRSQAANKDQISRGQELKKGQDVSPNLGQITDDPFLNPLGRPTGAPPNGGGPRGPMGGPRP